MEDEWVFDSLVGFLRGPVWNVPILTFIEHKSLSKSWNQNFSPVTLTFDLGFSVFEPDTDENEEEYQKTHEEYKNLVNFMLNSYMEDIGISSEQFETACKTASTKIKSEFHHSLFEQVWAADDYEIFKRMMIQKNIELQLQALELLQHRYGILPESLRPGKAQSDDAKAIESEKQVMEAVAK